MTIDNIPSNFSTVIKPYPVTQKHRRDLLPSREATIRDSLLSPIPPLPEKGNIAIHIASADDVASDHISFRHHETTLRNLSYIAAWYFFSASLSLYNKNLMGRDQFNFNFPLLVSAIHAGLHSIITMFMVWMGTSRPTVTMSLHNYLFKVVPCGIAAAVEIGCSNASLVYITLSFYTMVKSSTPIWVLMFSFMFGFEKPRCSLITIILVMVTGVILTVEGETKFDTAGFALVLVASVVSGLRWSMTQLLLQHESMGINHPIATLYYLSPVMFVTMLTLSLVFEHPFDQFQHSKHFDTISHVLESFGLMVIGGFLAFAMTLAELYLIKSTNTMTLSVAGISKEIVVIMLSILIYGDVLTPKTILGLSVSITGIIAYNYYKITKKKTKYEPVLLPSTPNPNRNLKD